MLASCRAFEFDDVTFGVGNIDRWTLSFRAVPGCDWTGLEAMRLQVAANSGFVERVYAQAEMIQIARLFSWRCATGAAKFAVNGYQINEALTGAELNKADFVSLPLNRASEYVTVEMQHPTEVDHPQHQMVDFLNADH